MTLLRAFDSSSEVMEAPIAIALLALIAYIAFQTWDMLLGGRFNPEGFALAVGAILGGGSVVGWGQGYLTRSRGHVRPDNPDGGL